MKIHAKTLHVYCQVVLSSFSAVGTEILIVHMVEYPYSRGGGVIDDEEEHEIPMYRKTYHFVPSRTLPLAEDVVIP